MTIYNYTSLAYLCDEYDLGSGPDRTPSDPRSENDGASVDFFRLQEGDGVRLARSRFPRWRSFAEWIGKDGEFWRGTGGLSVRLSPTWLKSR